MNVVVTPNYVPDIAEVYYPPHQPGVSVHLDRAPARFRPVRISFASRPTSGRARLVSAPTPTRPSAGEPRPPSARTTSSAGRWPPGSTPSSARSAARSSSVSGRRRRRQAGPRRPGRSRPAPTAWPSCRTFSAPRPSSPRTESSTPISAVMSSCRRVAARPRRPNRWDHFCRLVCRSIPALLSGIATSGTSSRRSPRTADGAAMRPTSTRTTPSSLRCRRSRPRTEISRTASAD